MVRQVSQILFLNRHQRETQVCLAAELAPDFKFGGTEVDVASPAVAPCGDLAGIARLDRCLELDIVQTCIEGDIAGNLILDENRAALGHDFTLNHTRNYGIAREVPPGEELVLLDGVPCVCNSGLVDLRLIDEDTFSVTIPSDYVPYYYELGYCGFSPMNLNFWFGEGIDIEDNGEGTKFTGDFTFANIGEKVKNARFQSAGRVSAGPYNLVELDQAALTATL